MSDSDSPPASIPFALTQHQRRLRTITAVLLLFIVAMIVFGVTSPFFHIARPVIMTPVIRKRLAVRGLAIMAYWTVCILLALSLLLVAWLDLREVRRKLLVARRDIWKDIAERSRERHEKSSEP